MPRQYAAIPIIPIAIGTPVYDMIWIVAAMHLTHLFKKRRCLDSSFHVPTVSFSLLITMFIAPWVHELPILRSVAHF